MPKKIIFTIISATFFYLRTNQIDIHSTLISCTCRESRALLFARTSEGVAFPLTLLVPIICRVWLVRRLSAPKKERKVSHASIIISRFVAPFNDALVSPGCTEIRVLTLVLARAESEWQTANSQTGCKPKTGAKRSLASVGKKGTGR